MSLPRQAIKQVVLEELDYFTLSSQEEMTEDDRLIADLGLTGDDAAVVVLEISKRLDVSVPIDAWDEVLTIGDVIRVLQTHC